MKTKDLIAKIKMMPGISTKPILSAADQYMTGLVDGKGVTRTAYRVSIRGYTCDYAYRKTHGEGSWVTIETQWRYSPSAAVNEWNRFVSRIENSAKRGEG